MSPTPEGPWVQASTYFCGPFPTVENVIVVTDAYFNGKLICRGKRVQTREGYAAVANGYAKGFMKSIESCKNRPLRKERLEKGAIQLYGKLPSYNSPLSRENPV